MNHSDYDRPLALIAGNGILPSEIKAELDRTGQPVLLIGIEGEIDPSLAAKADAVYSYGQLGSLFERFAQHGTRRLVMAGGVRKRPDFMRMKKDLTTLREVPRLLRIMMGGDNTVLAKISEYFGERGIEVIGAHEIVPGLLAEEGLIVGKKPGRDFMQSAKAAFTAAKTVGGLDAGQAAVLEDGRVIALEGAEGTDQMIERVARLREAGRIKPNPDNSILAKTMKPGQDMRADLPAIGPGTVAGCAKAGIRTIVVEADRTFILERKETLDAARASGMAIHGIKTTDGDGR